jgi:DNA-binding NtrC family response regulator
MAPLNILVVSGNAEQREQLVSVLRQAEHTTIEAGDGAGAAAQLNQTVEAVLLDMALPGLDEEALRRVLSSPEPAEPDSLEAAERRHLALVLRYTAGNKRKAALILGISRSTLLNKVRKYHLEER